MKTRVIYLACMALCFSSAAAAGQNVSPPLLASPPQQSFSMVLLPPQPAALSFAGERVPLENFDTRESLERELTVTAYMHSRTLAALLNGTRYLPMIEPILERNGIPADFKYLCMAESGFNPNISSPAGAAGLWQIMPALAKSKGLEVGPQIDERYHIEKSTQVACDFLKECYDRFGSWTMAAAAYNLGAAGLSKRVEKQRITDYYDLFLPEETLRYVFRILSWKLVFEEPARYGFMIAPSEYRHPLDDYREAEVGGKNIDWPQVAAEHGTTYKMLRELNHWIRDYDCANPSGRTYIVKLPHKKFRQGGGKQ